MASTRTGRDGEVGGWRRVWRLVSLIVSIDGFCSSLLSLLFSLANKSLVVVVEEEGARCMMARGRVMVVVDEKNRGVLLVVVSTDAMNAVANMFVDAIVSAATMAVLLLLRRVVLIIFVIF